MVGQWICRARWNALVGNLTLAFLLYFVFSWLFLELSEVAQNSSAQVCKVWCSRKISYKLQCFVILRRKPTAANVGCVILCRSRRRFGGTTPM